MSSKLYSTPSTNAVDSEKGENGSPDFDSPEVLQGSSQRVTPRTIHRNLKSRHIQLIGIGGTIGTTLYVSRV